MVEGAQGMAKILNFGSLNLDHVYSVDHFVQPGETLSSSSYQQFCGGKGLNQSIALAHAGADVFHAGLIGRDGDALLQKLKGSGVNVDYTKIVDLPSGHAIIQVDANGENSIILYGGANQRISSDDIDEVLSNFDKGDVLLLQNEINCISEMISKAKEKGMIVAFNPAPMNQKVFDYSLNQVDLFILNEIEAEMLSQQSSIEEMISSLLKRFEQAKIILTQGAKGVSYADKEKNIHVEAEKVDAIDTTAAGDTFIGFFLASWQKVDSIESSLKIACKASAICVGRHGASDSIPYLNELEA